MSDHANQRRIIKASPQSCFDMVSDVEKLSEWTNDIKEVQVLVRDEDGRPGDVSFRAAAMGRSTNYILRYSYGSNPLRISWRLVESDLIQRMNGDYEFHPVGPNGEETEVVYDLDVDLLVRLPGFVKRRAESKIVHAAVDDLKERLEAGNLTR
ncbi:MAG: cyclase [Actinobacteria bacterium]|nr:cyclase [Actinomycetota bacterium]MEC7810366.1 SRPBCC family protein [Actinomycetota bacterium]